MSADENDLKRRMDGALDALKREFAGLRTGRASTSLLENIQVDAYGSPMPMNQVASVSVPEPRMLSVQVWDNGNIKLTAPTISTPSALTPTYICQRILLLYAIRIIALVASAAGN